MELELTKDKTKETRSAWIEVSLNNLSTNVNLIKEYIKNKKSSTKLIAVVKGNAYGHSAIDVVSTILENGADMLATGILEEAVELRTKGINAPILNLGYTLANQAPIIVKYGIIQNVCTLELAKALSNFAQSQGKIVKVHIKIDTGLGRLGVLPKNAPQFVGKVNKLPNLIIDGTYTHLATAHTEDVDYCKLQVNRFKQVIKILEGLGLPTGIKHVANSSALVRFPEFHFDAVRCGALLFGIYASNKVPKLLDVQPVLRFYTKVVFVKKAFKGCPVGYSPSHITKRDSIIGIIPIGYADGFSKGFSGKVDVLVRGSRARIISVSMDMCFVDLTEIQDVKIGDEVVIIGNQKKDKIKVIELAKNLFDDTSEVLVSLGNSRTPHIFK